MQAATPDPLSTVAPGNAEPVLRIATATTFFARLRGLMWRPPLDPDAALLIPRCPSVHTFFMRSAIDIVYLDAEARAVKIVRSLSPWRFSLGGRRARQALELAPGGVERHAIRLGERVRAAATEKAS